MRRGGASLAIAACLLLLAQPAAAIVYGQPDTGNAYPNVGAMLVMEDGVLSQWCSGTFIGETSTGDGVFLTAAHCIAPLAAIDADVPGDVYISFSQDLDSADLITVQQVDVHPSFDFRRANPFDVGVLLFDGTDVPPGVTPAEIAEVGYLGDLGLAIRRERFTAVGYGTTRTTRRTGWQGILDNTERRFARQGFLSLQRAWLTLSMNQARGDGGTCYGDSGGPHFHEDVVVSLTIRGDTVCKATDATYRLDRTWVHDYLDDFIS